MWFLNNLVTARHIYIHYYQRVLLITFIFMYYLLANIGSGGEWKVCVVIRSATSNGIDDAAGYRLVMVLLSLTNVGSQQSVLYATVCTSTWRYQAVHEWHSQYPLQIKYSSNLQHPTLRNVKASNTGFNLPTACIFSNLQYKYCNIFPLSLSVSVRAVFAAFKACHKRIPYTNTRLSRSCFSDAGCKEK